MNRRDGWVRNSKKLTVQQSHWKHCIVNFSKTPEMNQTLVMSQGAFLKKNNKIWKQLMWCHFFFTCLGSPLYHCDLCVAFDNERLYDYGQWSICTQTALAPSRAWAVLNEVHSQRVVTIWLDWQFTETRYPQDLSSHLAWLRACCVNGHTCKAIQTRK